MQGNFITDRKGTKNPNYKHGKRNTRLFSIWINMLTRCSNKNTKAYNYYGGRGITVCDEWKNSFNSFYDWSMNNGYESNLTIDRIDVNGNYSPDNCRWTTIKTQANNRRNNHYVNINGVVRTLTEWCELYGINYRTVQDRLKRGWSVEKALLTPVDTRFRKKVV